MAVTTTGTFHLIGNIKAINHGSYGKPLLLRLDGRYGSTELTFFFEDESLAERLTEAINAAVSGPSNDDYDYAADDLAFDASREDRMFRK